MDAIMLPLTRIPAEDEAMRAAVRAFVEPVVAALPADVRARSWMGFDPAFSRALAERGWVGITLPREYGGGGRGPFARFVLVEELLACGAPVSAHWIADRQSGPMIARFGNEEQKRFYLPGICRAEVFFCIGMSEPGSGSDLASVRTKAVRVAGGWRLNGRKIWTTNAHRVHYMIALVRTSGRPADRHAGLSQVIVDLASDGVTIRPIRDLTGDAHFNEVAFEDVFVPDEALIGTEGEGWKQVNAELAFERGGPERLLSSQVLVDEWLNWLRSQREPAEAQVAALGSMLARLVTLRAMSLAVTARAAAGHSPMLAAALVKDLGTLVEQEVPATIADLLAQVAFPDSDVRDADTAAVASARTVSPSATAGASAGTPGAMSAGTRASVSAGTIASASAGTIACASAAPHSPPPSPVLLRTLAYISQVSPTFSLRGGTREILRGVIARGLALR